MLITNLLCVTYQQALWQCRLLAKSLGKGLLHHSLREQITNVRTKHANLITGTVVLHEKAVPVSDVSIKKPGDG